MKKLQLLLNRGGHLFGVLGLVAAFLAMLVGAALVVLSVMDLRDDNFDGFVGSLAFGLGSIALGGALFWTKRVRRVASMGWQQQLRFLQLMLALPSAKRRNRLFSRWLEEAVGQPPKVATMASEGMLGLSLVGLTETEVIVVSMKPLTLLPEDAAPRRYPISSMDVVSAGRKRGFPAGLLTLSVIDGGETETLSLSRLAVKALRSH